MRRSIVFLFILFLLTNVAYVHRLPGIMGDEAHEGENVFQILDTKKITVLGERSYIGPAIDYVRIPFVLVFGYTPLALRSVMLLASLTFFILSAVLLTRFLGKEESIIPLLLLSFSPIYVTQQRLGWAITLMPLFAVLLIYALQSSWKQKYLIAGGIAGLGLSNHLLFLPSLVAILVIAALTTIKTPRTYVQAWPIIIGFIAGFGMQFAVLQLYPDDQGSQKVIAETFMDRVYAFPSLYPEIISGSSYIASYTGQELSSGMKGAITSILSLLAIIALFFSKHRKVAWVIASALLIYLFVALRIVDRFSLRYFTLFVLVFWMVSGIGLDTLVSIVRKRSSVAANVVTSILCLGLLVWMVFGIVVPYKVTGGSTSVFSLGNRTDSAAALVDTTQLFECLQHIGLVYSENVHIYNRMVFWSRQYSDIRVVDEEHAQTAKYLVDYRISGQVKLNVPGTVCPELEHFRITQRT